MKKLNVAIIGLGVGERHLRGYQDDPRVSIEKLCDFNIEKVEERKRLWYYMQELKQNKYLSKYIVFM